MTIYTEPPVETPISINPVPIDVLADFVESHGWTKGFFERDGEYCLSWSMALVCGVDNPNVNISGVAFAEYSMRYRDLEERVIPRIKAYYEKYRDSKPTWELSIIGFNDDPRTSKYDVVKMLRMTP